MFRPRIAISPGRLFVAGVVIGAPARTPSAFVSYPASRDALGVRLVVKERAARFPCRSCAWPWPIGWSGGWRAALGVTVSVLTVHVKQKRKSANTFGRKKARQVELE